MSLIKSSFISPIRSNEGQMLRTLFFVLVTEREFQTFIFSSLVLVSPVINPFSVKRKKKKQTYKKGGRNEKNNAKVNFLAVVNFSLTPER